MATLRLRTSLPGTNKLAQLKATKRRNTDRGILFIINVSRLHRRRCVRARWLSRDGTRHRPGRALLALLLGRVRRFVSAQLVNI